MEPEAGKQEIGGTDRMQVGSLQRGRGQAEAIFSQAKRKHSLRENEK